MRIVNRHRVIPTATLRRLLKFSAKGIADAGIQVHVSESRGGILKGRAHEIVSSREVRRRLGFCWDTTTITHLITLKFPLRPDGYPSRTGNSYNLKRLDARWPDGIPYDDWQDAVVCLAAHEFRHIWQFRKRYAMMKQGRRVPKLGEYDAEKYSHNRLNEWRRYTHRAPVESAKQPNPFR